MRKWAKALSFLLWGALTALALQGCSTSRVAPTLTLPPTSTSLPIDTATLHPPSETPLPSATPTPVSTATATPLPIPEAVWLRWASGTYTDPPTVLTVRNGVPAYEPFPTNIVYFWSYDRLSGRLAYSSVVAHAKCKKGVTDLWIYDYAKDTLEQWYAGEVSGARWSPIITPETNTPLLGVAVMNDACSWDLVILSGPNNVIATIPNVSPHFSWSPDGQSIAFFKWRAPDDQQGVYVVSASGGEAVKIAPLGWVASITDEPIWAQEYNAIFFNDNTRGLTVALLDGSANFTLSDPELPFPYLVLWSPEKRQLIVGVENTMEFPARVIVYELSEDLRTFTNKEVIQAGRFDVLAGWLEPYKSIILVNLSKGGVIWSLDEGRIVSP